MVGPPWLILDFDFLWRPAPPSNNDPHLLSTAWASHSALEAYLSNTMLRVDPINDRLFPARPILAVSAAVFRQGRALIVRRARAPLIGHFSLPGGGVEVGETLAAALARELEEEVGVKAEVIAFNRHVEAIAHEGKRVRTHFVIASFVARWTRGEPRLSDEVDAVDWIDPALGLPSPTTPELGEVLKSAARIESGQA